jgi:hypothetical protein
MQPRIQKQTTHGKMFLFVPIVTFFFLFLLLLHIVFPIQESALAHGPNNLEGDHHAKVGELAYFRGEFTTNSEEPTEIRLRARHIESDSIILDIKSVSVDGSYEFGVQFFDGAEHEVTIQATDSTTDSILGEKKTVVEVEAFNPPTSVKMKTLIFLLFVIILGMVGGYTLARFYHSRKFTKGGNSYGI